MHAFDIIVVSVCGYLIGSIPFAVIIGKVYGINILEVGSGSPGATNIKRSIGKGAGNVCFLLDFLKGVLAAGWPKLSLFAAENTIGFAMLGLVAAILGHSYSLFIKFRGGKGVATTMGGLLVITPIALAVGIVIWVILFFTFRYVSVASIAFGISLPLTNLIVGILDLRLWLCLALAVIIILRHRSNIERLMKGTENRFQ